MRINPLNTKNALILFNRNQALCFLHLYIPIEDDDEEEDVAEGEEFDDIHTESSGEEDEVSQMPQQDTQPKEAPTVSQTNSASSLPPPAPDAATTAPNQVITWCPATCIKCFSCILVSY